MWDPGCSSDFPPSLFLQVSVMSFLLSITDLFISWLCEATLLKLLIVHTHPSLQRPEDKAKQSKANNKAPEKTQRFFLDRQVT